ncbi:MAG: ABC transporter ATP-binding protein [Candidatus Competibacteraceae bacterium]|nr:ABC transporter ATP-binding protein [Candidatus Competibacteraceae bacterium]
MTTSGNADPSSVYGVSSRAINSCSSLLSRSRVLRSLPRQPGSWFCGTSSTRWWRRKPSSSPSSRSRLPTWCSPWCAVCSPSSPAAARPTRPRASPEACRDALCDHLQKLPFSYHDRMQTGELIQRVTSDVDSVRRFYADQVIGISRIVFLFAINFTTIMLLNRRLALLSTLVVPFVVAVSIVFFNRISKAYDVYQDQDAVVTSILQENLSGVRVVKAFARQDFENEKFGRANTAKLAAGRRLLINNALYWPLSHLICAGQMLVGWSVGGFMTLRGELSIGTYLAYTGMLGGLIWPGCRTSAG